MYVFMGPSVTDDLPRAEAIAKRLGKLRLT
jgi:hypothetical protein